MKVSAFTYVRNGFEFGYPFIESIKSILPIVDEYIIVIGDSNDGTREAVEAFQNKKIKIIDTIWDPDIRSGGKIFAIQSNIGLDHVSKDADWLFHLQADEVIHEMDWPIIQKAMKENMENSEVEGLLLNFINFFGDYYHYCPSRRFHQKEVRILRNTPQIRSFKDSQGFRKYVNTANTDTEKGKKLKVKQIDATVYHYSWVKPPKKQKAKRIEFEKKYHETDAFIGTYEKKYRDGYDYKDYDYLKVFSGSHPAVMLPLIKEQDWKFTYDPKKNNMSIKEKFMKLLEQITGKQFFIYKNYKLIK